MIVRDIVMALSLEVVAGGEHLENEISGGYASDLLSCAMAGARAGNVWVTVQAHPNVVAVAELLGLAGVIVTEAKRPDAETLARANEKGIPMLLAAADTFTVVGRLAHLGVTGAS